MSGRVIQARYSTGIAPAHRVLGAVRAAAGDQAKTAFRRQPVQAHGAADSFAVDPVRLGLSRGGGQPLPDPVRAKMEAAFGTDFSRVRVHVGPQASRIGAIAFTMGHDIYFAPGQYRPESIQGQQLLGHELAHVVQQRQGRVKMPASGIAVVQDRMLEAEADRLGMRAALQRMPEAAPPRAPHAIRQPSPAAPAQRKPQAWTPRAASASCEDCDDCRDCDDSIEPGPAGASMAVQAKSAPYSKWQSKHMFRVSRSAARGLEKRHKGLSTSNILTYGRTRRRPRRYGDGLCAGYPDHAFIAGGVVWVVGRQFVGGMTDVCFDRQRHAGVPDIVGFAMTGTRTGDALAANAMRGLGGATPPGYTWHHKLDFVAGALGGGTCTMQLVQTPCHAGIFHHGAVAQWNAMYPMVPYGP